MSKSKTSDNGLNSYPSAQALIEAEAGRIFLALEEKSYIQVAYEFGLDRYLANEASMKSAITRAYNLVLGDSEKYGVPRERAAFIHGVVASRNIKNRGTPETIREETEIKALDMSSMLLGARDLAMSLVQKKLQYLDKNPKALKEEKLKDLGWIVGVLFDKGQVIQGQATEHIAVLSKVEGNMSPEDAMKALLQMRDNEILAKNK
jgi:hypothetical protein